MNFARHGPGRPGRSLDEFPDLMTIDELAAWTLIPVSTLYEWNSKEIGPVPVRMGKHLRYPKAAVLNWLAGLDRHQWGERMAIDSE